MKDWFNKLRTFLTEVRTEMKWVSFPSRDEVVATTIVVLVTSIVFAAYLWVADYLIQTGYVAMVRIFHP